MINQSKHKEHYEEQTPRTPPAFKLINNVRRVDPRTIIREPLTPKMKDIKQIRLATHRLGFPPDRYFCWITPSHYATSSRLPIDIERTSSTSIHSVLVLSKTEVNLMREQGIAIPIPLDMIKHGATVEHPTFLQLVKERYKEGRLFILDLDQTEKYIMGESISSLINSDYRIVMYRGGINS